MKFKLTIFLVIANAILFFCIYSLERNKPLTHPSQNQILSFSVLEISGKNIDKPRILKFENNRWRIVSPIDWKANLFAVNRIKNQLEFLDRKTSFSKKEVLSSGHSLSEYGLDTPAYVIKYGDGEKMETIKIGSGTSIGDRYYLLEEASDMIIVVDKEFVEALVQDMERLRDQSIFSMPRFEVSAFSVRLPVSKSETVTKSDFKRVGLVKDSGGWKFETPIVARADNSEVDAFLNDICQMVAVNFSPDKVGKTGLELSSLPTTITLQGTNRHEVLMLGALSEDGKCVYARLEDNPTIFAINSDILARLEKMQTILRDKVVMRTSPSRVTGIDISENGKTLKLRKLKSGVWDVIVQGKNGTPETVPANLALVNKLLLRLQEVKACQFVNDAAGKDLSGYGIGDNSLKISVISDNQQTDSISIGSMYRREGVNMRYASVNDTAQIYGIGRELSDIANTDLLFYRSQLVCSLRADDVIDAVKIVDLRTGKVAFEISSNNGDFSEAVRKFNVRQAASFKTINDFVRDTTASSFSTRSYNDNGVIISNDKTEKWCYRLEAVYSSKDANAKQTRTWLLSERLGASIQYCATNAFNALFFPSTKFINAFFELTQEHSQPERLDVQAPTPPAKQ